MTGSNTFVRRLMTDGAVLPRARVIYLARILCRVDIVTHLLRHGTNVRAGQLPAHMRAVFVATERSLLGLPPTQAASRATVRHDQTGVSHEQRVFVWASGVDAYLTAGRLAGHRPSEADLRAYLIAGRRFGEIFSAEGSYTAIEQIERLATHLMDRIMSASVPRGGWVSLMQVTNAEWFRRDSSVTQADVIRALEEAMPSRLLAALRRN